jgi:hypothetical protein
MAGFGVVVVGIAVAYWLVLIARRENSQPAATHQPQGNQLHDG